MEGELRLCARYGEDENVKIILEGQVNVNDKDEYSGNTALHMGKHLKRRNVDNNSGHFCQYFI